MNLVDPFQLKIFYDSMIFPQTWYCGAILIKDGFQSGNYNKDVPFKRQDRLF